MNGPTELNELRLKVASGTYVVDPRAVAEAMLSRRGAAMSGDAPGSVPRGRCSPVLVAQQVHRPPAAVEKAGTLAVLDAS